MIQDRLNHCVLIHAYPDLVDGIDKHGIMREYVNNDKKILMFGDAWNANQRIKIGVHSSAWSFRLTHNFFVPAPLTLSESITYFLVTRKSKRIVQLNPTTDDDDQAMSKA